MYVDKTPHGPSLSRKDDSHQNQGRREQHVGVGVCVCVARAFAERPGLTDRVASQVPRRKAPPDMPCSCICMVLTVGTAWAIRDREKNRTDHRDYHSLGHEMGRQVGWFRGLHVPTPCIHCQCLPINVVCWTEPEMGCFHTGYFLRDMLGVLFFFFLQVAMAWPLAVCEILTWIV